jgi:hypothetical protein
MNSKTGGAGVVALAIMAVIVGIVVVIGGWVIGILNQDTSIRVTVEQKQVDTKNQYDNLWKKISQVAQVTDAQKNAIKEILVGYADARSQGKGGTGSFVNALKEAVPNVDLSTFNNLQNIITGSRDSFTMRQTELLDLKREHDKLLRTIPSSIVCSIFGRKPIDVVIVTSSKTEKSFETGKDDDVSVFPVKK